MYYSLCLEWSAVILGTLGTIMWATKSKERKWAQANIKDKNELVFYPFGGPDITHPLQFFPDATEYILFGMEPIGEMFDIEKSNEKDFTDVLKTLNVSTSEVIGRNFFITHHMAKQIKTNKAGVASMMLFFLASNGAHIEDVQINTDMNVPNVKIKFTQNGIKKTVAYYNADISNEGFTKTPEFLSWLENKLKQTPHATMIKAASYLMWNKNFSQVKSLVINSSNTVLMDSSGFKVNSFVSSQWNVQYFGEYKKPIDSFKGAVDTELKSYFEKNKVEKLPFYYGYNNAGADNHIILAKRK